MNIGGVLDRVSKVRSVKSFAKYFLLSNMAGQKLFLYNEHIPRVFNLSFNESTCFYKCRMCLYSKGDVRKHYRKPKEMSFETLKGIVESVPNDPYYSCDISAVGETLEFGQVAEFIGYIKKERPLINTILSTNGVLLDEKMFTALAKAGLDNLQVSFFAGNAADHEFVTGTKTYEKVAKNLENACRIKREKGFAKPFIQTFILETKENSPATKDFLKRWTGKVDQAFVRPLLKRAMDIKGMTPMYDFTPSEKRRPCMQPWYSTAINSQGDVLPCYGFHWHEKTWDFNFGNLNDASLKEIWMSDKFREFREKHLALDLDSLPICQECVSWNDYTDIWEEGINGVYKPAPLTLRDFFIKSGHQRGG